MAGRLTWPRLPKRITVMGRDIRIRLSATLGYKEKHWGVYEDGKNLITLQRPDDEHTLDQVQAAFWHEAMHASLMALGYERLSNNEKLVEGLSQCIHQIIKSGK